jgi:hypothetical protein
MIIFRRSAQISIFLIIGIIIIILLVFVFTGVNSQKRIDIEDSKVSSLEFNKKIDTLKREIDYCLERELNRALLVSGLKGGYIYDIEGEYYFSSVIPDGTYSNDFLSNLNFNRNSLLSSLLVHSEYIVKSPRSNLEKSKFSDKSIEEDFELFIISEFSDCLNIEDFKSLGYELFYDDFEGLYLSSIGNRFRVSDMNAKLDDIVMLNLLSKRYYGRVIDNSSDLIVEFENLDSSKIFIPFDELNFINLNSSALIDVNFEEEEISVFFSYPITIRSGELESKYSQTVVSIPSRFKKILELSRDFLDNKYNFKRNEDDFSLDRFNQVANSNTYFRENGDFIDIYRFDLNNSAVEKKYIYSIVDNEFRIYGMPYVFNFAYENKAPVIDIEDSPFNFAGRDVLLVSAKNIEFTFDLKTITSDRQFIDNYNSYFIEDSYFGSDASFTVSNDGLIKFTGFVESRFNFPISVTDNETVRTENFVFITGFPQNRDNVDAYECFEFENQEFEGLPVDIFFKDKIFQNLEDEGDIFGFFINEGGENFGNLYFKESCLFKKDIFELKAELYDLNDVFIEEIDIDRSNLEMKYPHLNFPYYVKFSILSPNDNSLVTNPFKLKLYPSDCLGPLSYNLDAQNSIFGASLNNGNDALSCCDIEPLVNAIENGGDVINLASNSLDSFIGRKVLDTDLHLCIDENSNYNFKNNLIWNINPKITSMFGARVIAICQGVKAEVFPFNLNSITPIGSSSNYNPYIEKMNLRDGTHIDYQNQVNWFGLIEEAGTCEFCRHYDFSKKILDLETDDGIKFLAIPAQVNSDSNSLVGPLVDTIYEGEILCQEDYFGSMDEINWNLGIVGRGGEVGEISRGRKFCSVNTNACEDVYKIGSKRIDEENICKDWYFNGENIEFAPAPSSWICLYGDGENVFCDGINVGICS